MARLLSTRSSSASLSSINTVAAADTTVSVKKRGGRSKNEIISTEITHNLIQEEKRKEKKKEVLIFSKSLHDFIVKTVLARLDGRPEELILHGVDKTKTDLLSNVGCAVNDYRGNSSILIGARGSGKSTLIKQLIDRVKLENETIKVDQFILHGSLFPDTQSVLKILLAKIRQLISGSDTIEAINFSSEVEEEVSEFLAFDQFTALVKQYFNAKQRRYLIFVLEDLEKFAAHPQQNLLYCLFELASSFPVYVIGVSCRIDALELLEKRVKSRFSQNIIYLPLPETLEDFNSRVKENLLIQPDSENVNSELVAYNTIIEKFITSNETFNKFSTFYFDFCKDVRPIFRILTTVFVSLNDAFDWSRFDQHFEQFSPFNRPEITLNSEVLETTTVELLILVSMCRLAVKFSSTPVTFEAMAEELGVCKSRIAGLEKFVWTKSTIQVAFDRLLSARLIIPVTSSSSSSWLDRSYLTVRLGLPQFIILEAIEKHSCTTKEINALACERF